jgi:predicted ATPase
MTRGAAIPDCIAYRTAGYEVVEVPKAPTDERAAFVLEVIRP